MQAIRAQEVDIILDDLDFTWTRGEMSEAVRLWKDVTPFEDMVEQLRPELPNGNPGRREYSTRADEIFLLLLHLGRRGRISPRERGLG